MPAVKLVKKPKDKLDFEKIIFFSKKDIKKITNESIVLNVSFPVALSALHAFLNKLIGEDELKKLIFCSEATGKYLGICKLSNESLTFLLNSLTLGEDENFVLQDVGINIRVVEVATQEVGNIEVKFKNTNPEKNTMLILNMHVHLNDIYANVDNLIKQFSGRLAALQQIDCSTFENLNNMNILNYRKFDFTVAESSYETFCLVLEAKLNDENDKVKIITSINNNQKIQIENLQAEVMSLQYFVAYLQQQLSSQMQFIQELYAECARFQLVKTSIMGMFAYKPGFAQGSNVPIVLDRQEVDELTKNLF